MFSYGAVRDWKAKLATALVEGLRRRRHGQIGCELVLDETYIKVEANGGNRIEPSIVMARWAT